ncbi:unnamed protein product [Closterium sp. NIES-53]
MQAHDALASRVNNSSSSSTSASRASASNSSSSSSSASSVSATSSSASRARASNSGSSSYSATSARASSSSSSRLCRVSSSSAPNTTSLGSSSTPGTSTSMTSSRSTSSTTSSSGSSAFSTGSSTPKACTPNKLLTQLLRRQFRRSTSRTSRTKPRKTQGIARAESLSADVSRTKAREPQTRMTFKALEKEGLYDVNYYTLDIEGLVTLDMRLRMANPKLQTPTEAKAHINVGIVELSHTDEIHGVLGQTYCEDHAQRAAEFQKMIAMALRARASSTATRAEFPVGSP